MDAAALNEIGITLAAVFGVAIFCWAGKSTMAKNRQQGEDGQKSAKPGSPKPDPAGDEKK